MADKTPPAAPALDLSVPNVQTLLSDPETWRRLAESFGGFAMNLLAAAAIIAVTIWIAGQAARLVSRLIGRAAHRRGGDTTLQGFAASLVRYIIVIIGIVAAMQQLGVKATSIIAVLGAASLAIGLALQGALSNVAAGVMLLVFRPYRVGEFVEIAGKQGTVRTLDLFNTTISTTENLRVTIPNGKAFGDVIVNFSRPNKRRIELKFGIDYDDDLDAALDLLRARAGADKRVMKDPKPWAKVMELADSSVIVGLRCWVKPTDFWDTRFDLTKDIKESIEAAGLRFPYPHQVGVPYEAAHPPKRPSKRRQAAAENAPADPIEKTSPEQHLGD